MSNYYNRQWRLPNNENKEKVSNYSLEFDGTNLIYAANPVPLSTASSVSCWFKFRDVYSKAYIWTAGMGNGYPSLTGLVDDSKTLKIAGYFAAGGYSLTSYSMGEWIHSVLVYDGTNSILYVNGSQVLTTTAITNNLTASQNINIGAWNRYGNSSYTSYSYTSAISNIAVWNAALTSSQVTTLYGSSSTGIGNPMSLSPKPVAYYNLGDQDSFNGSNYLVPNIAAEEADGDIATSYSPYALDFDAASSGRIDTGAKILNNMTSYTASIWAKGWSTSTLTAIMSQYDGGSVSPLILTARHSANTNGFTAWLTLGGTFYTSHNDEGFSDNTKWVNLTVTWSGSDLILYVNGIAGDVTSASGTIDNSTTYNFHIGGYSNVTSNSYNGQLSNCSVWNAALTSSQVSEIYNEGLPSNLNSHSAYSNLVSWWQLGSNSSFNTNWTVLDEKGSNNGTSVNMTEDDIVDGVGSYANGLSSGMGGDEVIGDAPYSTANALSVNMDVEDRVSDTPS